MTACFPRGAAIATTPIVDCLFSVIVPARPNGDAHTTSLRRYSLLYCDTQLLTRDLHSEPVFEALAATLAAQLARYARQRVFVRAGVVEWGNRAIVVLANSRERTSSLVAALCSAGARYWSDMFAVFDKMGRVHPYESASAEPTHVLPVALILDSAHAARTSIDAMSSGQAMMALLSYIVPGRASPSFALRTLQRATQNALALRERAAETTDIMERILNRIDS